MPKRNRPIAECLADHADALDRNDFERLDEVEKELDSILMSRLRRLSYKNYPAEGLAYLVNLVPASYNTKAVDRLFRLWATVPSRKREELLEKL